MKNAMFYFLMTACSACGSGERGSELETKRIPLIVCDGNSLTFGSGADNPETDSYPALLKAQGFNTVNLGIAGQTTELMLADSREEVDPLFTASGDISIAWEGINSFAVYRYSAQKSYDLLAEYVRERRERGFTTVVVTMLPSGLWAHGQIGMEAYRQDYNGLIRENSAGADYVLDLDLVPQLTDPHDDVYFSPKDHVHLTTVGYQVLAKYFSDFFESGLK